MNKKVIIGIISLVVAIIAYLVYTSMQPKELKFSDIPRDKKETKEQTSEKGSINQIKTSDVEIDKELENLDKDLDVALDEEIQ